MSFVGILRISLFYVGTFMFSNRSTDQGIKSFTYLILINLIQPAFYDHPRIQFKIIVDFPILKLKVKAKLSQLLIC